MNIEQTNEALQQAFSNFANSVQQPAATNTVEQPQVEPETPKETEPQVTAQEPEVTNENPTNQAFARMRSENSAKTKQLESIEAALKKQGYAGIQDYLDKQNAAELQQQAQKQGISPELEKRIQTLEQENARYKEQERAANLKTEVGNLVQKYGISKQEWEGFTQQLVNAGVNPLTSNVPLETLYVQYNLENIFNRRLEREKQAWMQNQSNANAAPINTPAGTPPQTQSTNNKVSWADMATRFKSSKK